MKIQILDTNGSKVREATSKLFDGSMRIDLIQKIAEAEKINDMLEQEYAPFLWAGMQTSASGNVKHNRHVWKTDRGKGMSRFPKKRMSDKGDRFSWVGAVVPGTRGGRRAHPPKLIRANLGYNRKEFVLGLLSCLALSTSTDFVNKKYASLADKKITTKFPLVFDDKILSAKTICLGIVFNSFSALFEIVTLVSFMIITYSKLLYMSRWRSSAG